MRGRASIERAACRRLTARADSRASRQPRGRGARVRPVQRADKRFVRDVPSGKLDAGWPTVRRVDRARDQVMTSRYRRFVLTLIVGAGLLCLLPIGALADGGGGGGGGDSPARDLGPVRPERPLGSAAPATRHRAVHQRETARQRAEQQRGAARRRAEEQRAAERRRAEAAQALPRTDFWLLRPVEQPRNPLAVHRSVYRPRSR
jgi:hypothetical protein